MSTRLTLEELYRDHFDFVYRIAKHLGGNELHPEDVAQDVFLVVSRKLESYRPLSRVTTWLYGITHNVVRSHRRRLRIERFFRADESEGDDVANSEGPDVAEVADAWEIASGVLQQLSEKKRDVFVLAELEGLSCAEIAAIVGSREQTVWSRLHYARKEFDRRLRAMRPELFSEQAPATQATAGATPLGTAKRRKLRGARGVSTSRATRDGRPPRRKP